MSSVTIRPVEGDEMHDILFLLDNYAFRPTPPFPNREEWDARLKNRKGSITMNKWVYYFKKDEIKGHRVLFPKK